MNQLAFEKENRKRMEEVQKAFGTSGIRLSSPGRVLIGEGSLMKQGRKKWDVRIFFLFNDILVYGSVLLKGRWFKKHKIIPLEDIKLEDLEDSEEFKHQWLICTPRKSFFVSAASLKEKQAWMEQINTSQQKLLRTSGRRQSESFANTWFPDVSSEICMRCTVNFSNTNRRHHCRKCGFLVCNRCSKQKEVISHIHPTKQLRICTMCNKSSNEEELARSRGGSAGTDCSDSTTDIDEDLSESEEMQNPSPSSWAYASKGAWQQTNPH